ncbi:MAG: hypothetical protein WBF71_09720 [Microthrixaceae bacterium]
MDHEALDPIAELLVPAYTETAIESRAFRDKHGDFPPTAMWKAHTLRSIVQAQIHSHDRFTLRPDYADYGRVQFLDEKAGTEFLLRSDAANTIERARAEAQLFRSSPSLTLVILLLYRFHRAGMDLAVAGTRRQVGKNRLEAAGPATFVGTWPYTREDGDPFPQGPGDAFDELGPAAHDVEEGDGRR